MIQKKRQAYFLRAVIPRGGVHVTTSHGLTQSSFAKVHDFGGCHPESRYLLLCFFFCGDLLLLR